MSLQREIDKIYILLYDLTNKINSLEEKFDSLLKEKEGENKYFARRIT